MDLQLAGKRALVCAASRGIGYAIAEGLVREGASVYVCSRDAAAVEAAVARLAALGSGSVRGGAFDLGGTTDTSSLANAASTALGGGLDILVSNVGGPPPTAAADTDATAWRAGFEQLFQSAVSLTQCLLPGMKERRFGRILAITSLSVVEPIEQLAISTAMRAGLTAWLKLLATEVAGFGITVNALMPGVIHTQRIEDLRKAKAARAGTTLGEELRRTEATIPCGRMGRPEELADLACFLASPRAAYVTGANIAVDGGLRRSVAT